MLLLLTIMAMASASVMATQAVLSSTGLNGNAHDVEYCAANEAAWKAEVLEREKGLPAENWAGAIEPRVCTRDDWQAVWPKDHKDYHDDFDERHLSVAARLPSGDIEVQIPWRTERKAWKAGYVLNMLGHHHCATHSCSYRSHAPV